ncbi:hypothetical protein MTBBW1_80060 [Desulfamplus magnetovallimortis]|uniref:Uncharacterized protein n=1 Tax=Desulfamplus magnetovallimortis TaxID=1246637 RepID=L0R6P4_9BACT|nr:hypothetical protein DEMABW1_80060 [Desulfamplus magnetovallimortis BW-1]SLM32722.1 hypothetical protein MTBBW1_80060 [Desulfamplus magnetovallimortis]
MYLILNIRRKYRLPEKYFGILNSEGQPQEIAPKVLANLIIWNSIVAITYMADDRHNRRYESRFKTACYRDFHIKTSLLGSIS